MKLIFFDTETTGLKPGSICQLSYITVDTSMKPNSTTGKNIFFAVDYVEPSAEEIHGFSAEDLYELSEGMYFEDHFENIYKDFSEADFVIGHNVNFDINFLTHEIEGCGEEFKPNNVFCTMNYYKDICKMVNGRGERKNPKLEELVRFLGINNDNIREISNKLFEGSGNYHDARFDTTATYLAVTEGIKKGYIPRNYFSSKV
ncbi:3'-5' exonuclease [Clostridium sp. 19966]|uniref:3'-5' exonuclease n=1 Tax=Clostridium sp. 19966 TaxID=2768166 RepID=UPI0028DEA0D7|nr:3'-5' exonuclease [Clostridium sp. 19966]MDT8718739.1 3'-5' exonuclease [Clostridium sp. 19966]